MNNNKIYIGLIQINNSFSGQNYFPYTVGLLQTYVKAHSKQPERYEFLLPIYKREKIQTIAEKLKDANVVAFSTYVWNMNLSLAVAKQIKAYNPNVLTIFGGPQVPDSAEYFLL